MSYNVSQTLRKDLAGGQVTLTGDGRQVLLEERVGPHKGQLAVNGAHNPATLDLDFANGRYHLDDGGATALTDPVDILTVERATPKWVMGPSGRLREVPPNTLAREFDPVTGKPRGMLIEESRTNLLTWSEDFTQEAWITGGASITANANSAPDGSLSAVKLVEDSTSGVHDIRQILTQTESGLVLTGYFKAGERRYVALLITSSSGSASRAVYDLVDGLVTEVLVDGTTAEIEPLADGWYRCVLRSSADTVASGGYYRLSVGPNYTDREYQGDGTSGIYIWGAQLEAASTPSSYIKTEDSPATRSADNVSRVLGEEFNRNECTLYCEFYYDRPSRDPEGVLVTYPIFGINDETDTSSYGFKAQVYGLSGVTQGILRWDDGTATAETALPVKGWNRLAIAFNSSGSSISLNGTYSFSSGTAPDTLLDDLTHLYFTPKFIAGTGARYRRLEATFGDTRLYPRALSEAELVELTK